MDLTVFGLDISAALLALGAITGMTYGILAVGLVLVYRSTKVINFAHGEIGAFGAAVAGVLAVQWGIPYWLAFAAGIAASVVAGAGTELVVVRRLRNAPTLMSLVATLGVGQFLLAFSSVINSKARSGSTFPHPAGFPQFSIGVLRVTPAYSAMLILSPVIVVVLAVFLRRSRTGLEMRASAANLERARMAGVSAARMSTLAWGLAGAVAAYTTILIIPTRGFITADALGPSLLLRALAPAAIARLSSLPVALAAGLGIGIIDQILIFNYPSSGVAELFILATVVVAFLLRSRRGGRSQERQNWGALQPWGPLPEALLRVRSIRNLNRTATVCGLGIAVVLGLTASNRTAVTYVWIVAFALIGLSLGIITGLGGQLSLGQFAVAAVGATASHAVAERTGNFLLGLLAAGAAAGLLACLLGLPALRVRGLLLGVVTLAFALAAQRWLLSQNWMLDSGVSPQRPEVGPVDFTTTKSYFWWALGVFGIGYYVARNVWRGGVGLRLRAVRDNEDGAQAFGISAWRVKLQGFALAGVLAGFGGAVFGHLLSRLSPQSFDVVTSINVVALTVLGGIGMLAGPVLGAAYIIGIPRFLPLDNAGLAASALGWLVLLLYFPGGIAQLIAIPRRHLIRWLAHRNGLDAGAIERGDAPAAAPRVANIVKTRRAQVTNELLLDASGLTKRFGGVRAVDGVDVSVRHREILGLIGPNGAGKTTLFELLGGFTAADGGRIQFLDRDITHTAPEERAQRGLIRSFQDAALFPTLTVHETVVLAYERLEPTNTVASSLGWQRAEGAKASRASEVLGLMGLEPFRDKQIRELSTGTRRITELACVVALEPVVLLLDEPSSGIAQRESEALGELLLRLRDHLDCSMILIEHDIPLLMSLSTRVMAMDSGRVIAVGSPAEVRNDPIVVSSYLGSSTVAIERSGPRPVEVG